MRRIAMLLALALVAAACGDDSGPDVAGPFPADAFAFAASSDLAVGQERLLVAVAGPNGERLPSPEIPVAFRVFQEGREDQAVEAPGAFRWAIPDVNGLYSAVIDFDEPGVWMVEVTPEGGPPLALFPIDVQADPSTPALGEPAPRSETPTLGDAPIETFSTDPDPDPGFYDVTVAEAVSNGTPAVIVFATPQFCSTAICGPTLDAVKEMAQDHSDVDFVHVEVFTNLDDPENLAPVPAVIEWGLLTEPWVFVVDAAGLISGRFEGLVSEEELAEALDT